MRSAGLVPDDITGYREPGPDGKPVWVEGILKKGEMRKDDAQMFIMKARVLAGWIEQVYADETRPWLQGARLTAWELVQDGIPEAIPLEMCYLGWQESLLQLAHLVEPDIPG